MKRICGRWFHLASGRSYHEEFHPPRVPGKDDVTGEALVRRNDDNPEVLKKRLEQYHSLTKPLVGYYTNRGLHSKVDASQQANSVFGEIQKIFLNARSKYAFFNWIWLSDKRKRKRSLIIKDWFDMSVYPEGFFDMNFNGQCYIRLSLSKYF